MDKREFEKLVERLEFRENLRVMRKLLAKLTSKYAGGHSIKITIIGSDGKKIRYEIKRYHSKQLPKPSLDSLQLSEYR